MHGYTRQVPVTSSVFWFAVRVRRWRIAAGTVAFMILAAGGVKWLRGSDDDIRADLVAQLGDTPMDPNRLEPTM